MLGIVHYQREAAWGIALVAVMAVAGLWNVAQAQRVYSPAQAAAGQAAYQAECAMCHQNDLSGGGAAPALAGTNFLNQWGNLSVDELVDATRASMPPNNPGRLSGQTYLNITAFVLQANGAVFGNQPLIASVPVEIGTLATGLAPAGLFDNAGPGAIEAPQGVTVVGRVENFVPVTAEMKINPDPAD